VLSVLALGLAACSDAQCQSAEQGFHDFFMLIVALVVIGIVLEIGFLVVLVVGIVKLVKNAPSFGWGVAAIVGGAMIDLPVLITLVQHPRLLHMSGLYGLALLYVGVRNVQRARPDGSPAPAMERPRRRRAPRPVR
jgi:hypothetical protein